MSGSCAPTICWTLVSVAVSCCMLVVLRGKDPIHPSSAAYQKMASSVIDELHNSEVRYTEPPTEVV